MVQLLSADRPEVIENAPLKSRFGSAIEAIGAGTFFGILAAVFGVAFIIVLIAIAVVVPEPTQFQFDVFKSVLALAGAACAVFLGESLRLRVRFLRTGAIRLGAPFLIFLALWFYSPASLLVQQSRLKVDALWSELNDTRSAPGAALFGLDQVWDRPEFAALWHNVKNSHSATDLAAVKKYLDNSMKEGDVAKDFATLRNFYVLIADCSHAGECDRDLVCKRFFARVQEFRNSYCGVLRSQDIGGSSSVVMRLKRFVFDDCRLTFMASFLNPREVQEDISSVCLPLNCWEDNVVAANTCVAANAGISPPNGVSATP